MSSRVLTPTIGLRAAFAAVWCVASCTAAPAPAGPADASPADAGPADVTPDVPADAPAGDAADVMCLVDEQCSSPELGLRRICDPETHHCAFCAPSRADSCAEGQFCAEGRCLPGCARDQACRATSATPFCDLGTHRCVACLAAPDCGAYAGAQPRCTDGVCGFRCEAGRGDCDGLAANGCEVDLAAAVDHCGRCDNRCPAAPNGTARCASGACDIQCEGSRRDCDGDRSNGCEADIGGDARNCGACGRACPGASNATGICADGVCSHRCATGFGDCDGDPMNGCEADVRTSTSHCGRCGLACGPGGACVAGACVTCPAGQAFCGGGCVALATDARHCGRCDLSCGSGLCVDGVCSARLIRRVSEMEGLVADADGLYYATRSNRTIRRVSYDGATDELVLSYPEQTFALAADATNFYWSAGATDPSHILARPRAGGAVRELCAADCPNVWGVAVDSGNLLWGSNPRGLVVRRDVSSGAETTFGPTPSGVWYVASNRRWIVAAISGQLHRIPTSGGVAAMFGTLPDPYYHALALDDADRVVIANSRTGGIVRIPVAGGAFQTIVPPAPARGRAIGPFKGLAIRGGTLYFGVADDTRGLGLESTIEAIELPP